MAAGAFGGGAPFTATSELRDAGPAGAVGDVDVGVVDGEPSLHLCAVAVALEAGIAGEHGSTVVAVEDTGAGEVQGQVHLRPQARVEPDRALAGDAAAVAIGGSQLGDLDAPALGAGGEPDVAERGAGGDVIDATAADGEVASNCRLRQGPGEAEVGREGAGHRLPVEGGDVGSPARSTAADDAAGRAAPFSGTAKAKGSRLKRTGRLASATRGWAPSPVADRRVPRRPSCTDEARSRSVVGVRGPAPPGFSLPHGQIERQLGCPGGAGQVQAAFGRALERRCAEAGQEPQRQGGEAHLARGRPLP